MMNEDSFKTLLTGALTIGIPVILFAGVLIYSVFAMRRTKRLWRQAQNEDPALAEYVRQEEQIKPGRNWYSIPVLLFIAGWTGGIFSISFFGETAGLAIAFGVSSVALLIIGAIKFLRAQSRKRFRMTTAQQKFGNRQRLGFGGLVVIFLSSVFAGVLVRPLLLNWIRTGHTPVVFGKTNETANSNRIAPPNTNRVPANFPADIPIYPGAGLISDSAIGNDQTVLLQTTDSLEKVVDFYRRQLKSDGWKISSIRDKGDKTVIQASKDKHLYTLGIKPGTAQTLINISVSGQ